MVEGEWLWPTYGEFGTQRKVMWDCTICVSCGSAVLYFQNLPLTNAAALIFIFSFYVGRSDLSMWSHLEKGS